MLFLLLEKMYCLFQIFKRPLLRKLYPLEYNLLKRIMSILKNYPNMESKDLLNSIPWKIWSPERSDSSSPTRQSLISNQSLNQAKLRLQPKLVEQPPLMLLSPQAPLVWTHPKFPSSMLSKSPPKLKRDKSKSPRISSS